MFFSLQSASSISGVYSCIVSSATESLALAEKLGVQLAHRLIEAGAGPILGAAKAQAEAEAKAKAEATQLQRELEEAKAEKARLEKEEESSKNDNADLASELKTELDNLRKELENVDDEDSDEEDDKTPKDAKEDYAAKMAKKGATLPKGFIKDAKANTGH